MKRVILWLIILFIIVGVAYRSVHHRQERRIRSIAQIQMEEGIPVMVERVEIRPFRVEKTYIGTLVGKEEGEVVPLVGEYITQVVVKEGDRVKAGDPICHLARNNPQAGYLQAQLAVENAERELARMNALYQKGAISRQMLDNITLQRDLARKQLETAERLLILRSPIDGIVSELKAEEGKFATPGIPLAKIVDDTQLRAKIEIPSGDGEMMKSGLTCQVNLGNESCSGVMKRVALSADKEGRSFEAWIYLNPPLPSAAWRSGVMVEVKVVVFDEERALTIPPEAVVREASRWTVYRVNGDRAERVEVIPRGWNSEAVWVRDGLNEGDQVVVVGGEALFPGAKVRIIEPSNDRAGRQQG